MKVLLSPAKSLDFDTEISLESVSSVIFPEKASQVNAVLRKKSPKQLRELMGISEQLATLNYDRNQQWSTDSGNSGSRAAIFAFSGEVYRGLNVASLSKSKHEVMQKTLRILSGQYGVLRPLDVIMPYRLEMGTKLPVGTNKNLYEFWRTDVTELLQSELNSEELVVNLASKEYAKCVDFKSIKNQVVTPVFKEFKNGTYKVLAVYAKHARGLMARYIIDHNCRTLEDLKSFQSGGYIYSRELSGNNELVFIR